MARVVTALTIAGSDSGGCAGIQADLKTFAALGVHGASVLTAVTAQNTRGVRDVFELPPAVVESQIEAVAEDLKVGAVKTGMLSSAALIGVVSRQLKKHAWRRLVVDPVMVATSGDPLLGPDAVGTLRRELLPLALIVTPNLREAEILAGIEIRTGEDLEEAARRIHRLGPRAVLIKGGHSEDRDESTDLLYDGTETRRLPAPRIDTPHTHGSGCTLSAAICAYLAKGHDLTESVSQAKSYVTRAIEASYAPGRGRGPLGHFFGR